MEKTDDEIITELSALPEIELKILAILHMSGGSWFGYGNCYYPHNAILAGEGNITDISDEVGGKKGLSKLLKPLRDKGYVHFMRGLMTEDGEVAGSGHAPDPSLQEALEQICEQRGWL